jgi:cell division septation protein DedD
MTRNWLRLVLAVAIASAISAVPLAMSQAQAQSVSKKKAAAKKAAEEGQETPEGEQKKKRQDPVEAQKTIEAALKLIESGKADAAVQSLSATLSAGNLPPGLMARALYYRGVAYRQQQKPGQAIADLTQALWIKGGLSETDRGAALSQRSGAYADAGLAEPAPVVAANKPATTASNTSSGSGTSWNPFGGFGNSFSLFSSGGQSSQPVPPPAAPAPAPAAPLPPPTTTASTSKPAMSSWSSSTEVRATPVAMAPERAAPIEASAPRAEGKFRVQLGLVRTDGEAQAIISRVRGDLSGVFEAREPSVEETVVGNFGAMYRVRVGPYASANEGNAVCARLKGSGLDCLVVTQ